MEKIAKIHINFGSNGQTRCGMRFPKRLATMGEVKRLHLHNGTRGKDVCKKCWDDAIRTNKMFAADVFEIHLAHMDKERKKRKNDNVEKFLSQFPEMRTMFEHFDVMDMNVTLRDPTGKIRTFRFSD